MSELLAFYESPYDTKRERCTNEGPLIEYKKLGAHYRRQIQTTRVPPEVTQSSPLLRHPTQQKNDAPTSQHGSTGSTNKEPLLVKREQSPPTRNSGFPTSQSHVPSPHNTSETESENLKTRSPNENALLRSQEESRRLAIAHKVMQWPSFAPAASQHVNGRSGVRLSDVSPQEYLIEFHKRMLASNQVIADLPKPVTSSAETSNLCDDLPLDLSKKPAENVQGVTNKAVRVLSRPEAESSTYKIGAKMESMSEVYAGTVRNRTDETRACPPPPYLLGNHVLQSEQSRKVSRDVSAQVVTQMSAVPIDRKWAVPTVTKNSASGMKRWSEDARQSARIPLQFEHAVCGRRNSAPAGTKKDVRKNLDLRSYTGCLPPHFLHLLESSGNLPVRTHNALLEVADVFRPTSDEKCPSSTKRACKRPIYTQISSNTNHSPQNDLRVTPTSIRSADGRDLACPVTSPDLTSHAATKEPNGWGKADVERKNKENKSNLKNFSNASNDVEICRMTTAIQPSDVDRFNSADESKPQIRHETSISAPNIRYLSGDIVDRPRPVQFEAVIKMRHFVTANNLHKCSGCEYRNGEVTEQDELLYISRKTDPRYTSAPRKISPKLLYCAELEKQVEKSTTSRLQENIQLTRHNDQHSPLSNATSLRMTSSNMDVSRSSAEHTSVNCTSVDQNNNGAEKTNNPPSDDKHEVNVYVARDGFTKLSLSESDCLECVSDDSGTDTWEPEPSLNDIPKKAHPICMRKNSLDAKLEQLRQQALLRHQSSYETAVREEMSEGKRLDSEVSDDDFLANSIQDSDSEPEDEPFLKKLKLESTDLDVNNNAHNSRPDSAITVRSSPRSTTIPIPPQHRNVSPISSASQQPTWTSRATETVESKQAAIQQLLPSAYYLPTYPHLLMKPMFPMYPLMSQMSASHSQINKKLLLLINNDLWRQTRHAVPRIRVFPPDKRQHTAMSEDVHLNELEISDEEDSGIA
nr:uncharacterized protein LOC100183824 [Ciona intestinalis]|eukprot:XP_002120123.3 uncharacterized protein LOC100183824 [Ciona intestinalis]